MMRMAACWVVAMCTVLFMYNLDVVKSTELSSIDTGAPSSPLRQMTNTKLSPGVEVGTDGAYVDCPCIDYVHDQQWASILSDYLTDSNRSLSADGRTFQRGYGSTYCNVWAPADRLAKWCYVNGSQCERPDKTASFYFRDLHWSYTTCGNIGDFSPIIDFEAMLPIYAGDLSQYGDFPRTSLQPNSGYLVLDMTLMFSYHVLEDMGLSPKEVQYRALSNASKSLPTYTGCVQDIALGNLDLCLGDWWFTMARSRMKVTFIPVFNEPVRLAVRRSKPAKQTDWDKVMHSFEPFSLELWIMILGALLLACFLMILVEKEKDDLTELKSILLCRHSQSVWDASYTSAMSFASFSSNLDPRTPAGKILALGIAFFLTIAGASFTANTAQFLITEARNQEQFKDLTDMFNAGEKVCYPTAMFDMLITAYPQIKQLGVGLDINDWFYGLKNKLCTGTLASELAFHGDVPAEEQCDFEFIGSPVHSYPTGFYANQELGFALKYAVSRKTSDGTWNKIYKDMLPQSACSAGKSDDADPSLRQLEPRHMLGSFFVMMASAALALVVHCCSRAKDETIRMVKQNSKVLEELQHLKQEVSDKFSKLHGSVEEVRTVQMASAVKDADQLTVVTM